MKVVADICITPVGAGVSLSAYIAACERILGDRGLNPRLHAYGTNVEGEWDAVFEALRICHEKVHAMGAPRIQTSIRVGSRTDREQGMDERVESVRRRLAEDAGD